MSRWFRIYDEALNDPKVQKLAPHLFKTWFNLLCLANKAGNGVLPSISDIAYHLRISDIDAQAAVDDLIMAGLLDISADKKLTPHNWAERQAPSDKSKDRTRKWRAGKRVTVCDGHGDGVVTGGDGKSDGLDKTRIDSDNNLASSHPASPREKARKQDHKIDLGRDDGKQGIPATLTKRAEGLGLPVAELEAQAKASAKTNQSAYFTTACVNRIRDKVPKLPEQMIRDALWGKSPAAWTAVTGALLMSEGQL